ncbi:hypothetical protein PG985_003886 [Apiospora marii]|uniref:Uncharacterized protein n=1 Tax=Apiospora marii TaxID=335849 RepID=A0ABR1SGW0_9PEZI
MQYTTILLCFLTMATAMKLPLIGKRATAPAAVVEKRADGPLRVSLDTEFFDNLLADFFGGVAAELLATDLGELDTKFPGFQGPYKAVTLNTNNGTATARCQLIDTRGQIVTLVRGPNVDTTFGDGGNGPWRAQNGGAFFVREIKCDPTFRSANANNNANNNGTISANSTISS